MPGRGFKHFCTLLLLWFAIGSAIPALATENDIGLLWKAESPSGKTSYLFGTMHSDDARINEFSPDLVQAIAASDTFMVEVLPSQNPASLYMKDANLAQLLTEEEYDKLVQLADFHAMRTEDAARMKPWLLAVIFDLPKPHTIFSQDIQLLGIAENYGKKVNGLEQPEQHFATLDSFSLDEQLVMLRAVLKRSQEEKERDFEALLNAYLTGDTRKIAGLDDQLTEGMLPKALWEKMRTKFLDERNVRMAQSIIETSGQGSAFIAVGASHLAGQDGLLARLRQAGFKLTAMKGLNP